jgi:CheY-like chemotaxis protein
MVQECRGTISVASAPGQGSIFTVRLPAEARRRRPSEAGAPAAARHPLTSSHILVVEDEDNVARLMLLTLDACGYSTLHAATGLEALEAIRDHKGRVGLVVLDLMLPELGGEEVFRLLKGLVPEVPVLLITGREDVARSLAPEVPLLPKPFTAVEFLEAVARALASA